MTKFLLAGAAAIAICGVAIAQSAPPPQTNHRGHKMQTENRADVQAHVQRMFARLDSNSDGFVTKQELDARQAARSERLEKRADRAEERAKHFDPNKMFGRLDADKDGKITRAEAEAARKARVERHDGKPAEAHAVAFGRLFERADANKDGVITRAEFDAAPRPDFEKMHARAEHAGMHRNFGDRMLEHADANKDGRLSLAEAQAAAYQRFDRADLNHDGKLTPEERQQKRQLRGQHRPS